MKSNFRFFFVSIFIVLIVASGCEKDDDDAILTVRDYDGNKYKTVKIGNQIWMAENLKTTHYADGTEIKLVESTSAWDNLDDYDKAYCFYDNSSSNGSVYGALYTWAAAVNRTVPYYIFVDGFVRGVCPDGWHLPNDSEWKELEMYLGMSQNEAEASEWRGTDEGGKMKESGTEHWYAPNTDATNKSGFTALPGGYRSYDGTFNGLHYSAKFWCGIEVTSSLTWSRWLYYYNSKVYRYNYLYSQNYGYSVRCLKN